MKYEHLVKNGTIVNDNISYQANIYIKDGKISIITKNLLDVQVDTITDAEGYFVLPGLIDTHVHSRDGGGLHKEDFYHSTQAAAAGGITTIFEMPNTNPPVNNLENFNKQVDNLSKKAHVNFGLWGICLGELNINNIQELSKAGVIGFKYFWGYAVNKENYQLVYNYDDSMTNVIPPCDDGEVFNMFEEVTKTGKIMAVHAENSELINNFFNKADNPDKNEYDNAVERRPSLAEELTIQTGISFAKELGTKFHVLHISSKEGIELVKEAQEKGLNVTGETCPHYLFLTNNDFEHIGNNMKVYPLVKYKEDQERLWQGIREGTLSLICSDHAPHTEEEKIGDFNEIPAGMCGVETLAPLMLNAVSEKKITLNQVVSLLSTEPAKLFGIYPQKGSIEVGADADLTIIDMDYEKTIQKHDLHSKSKVTAYDGFAIKGLPIITIVNGMTVMKNGSIVSNNAGQFIKV
jgi:allantoinase